MLPPGIFNGLTSLTVIYASENQLEEIPESLFRGLNSLYRIDLNDNLLSSLAASTFCGLSSLHMLFLYRNRVNFNEASWLSSRSNACPIYTCSWASPYPGQYSLQVHPLYSQTHISLSCLENAPIPADAEYIFFNLDNPNLTKKPSISFPSNMLNGLRNLTYFYVGKINVFDFPYQLFWEATSLELIYIQESTIYPDLPWFMFFGLSKLIFVQMQSCGIRKIPEYFFYGATNLLGIQFDKNELETLPLDLFSYTYKLEGIFLNENKLSYLPDGIFNSAPLSKLNYLDLRDNMFTNFEPSTFCGLLKLYDLFLSGNAVDENYWRNSIYSAFSCSCTAGWYERAHVCTRCPAGTYSYSLAMTYCTNCSTGFYAPFESRCRRCPNGTYSLEKSPSCTSCSLDNGNNLYIDAYQKKEISVKCDPENYVKLNSFRIGNYGENIGSLYFIVKTSPFSDFNGNLPFELNSGDCKRIGSYSFLETSELYFVIECFSSQSCNYKYSIDYVCSNKPSSKTNAPDPTYPSNTENSSTGENTGAIVGGASAGCILLALGIFGVFYSKKKRRNANESQITSSTPKIAEIRGTEIEQVTRRSDQDQKGENGGGSTIVSFQ